MNIQLPDGTIINDVPDGTTQAQLAAKLQANGYDISKLTGATAPVAKQYASAVPQPGVRNPTDQPLPETKSDPGLLDRVVGTLEAPYSVALNAVGGALAPYAGVVGELVGGVNTPEGRAKGKQWGAAVQKNMTYTPQTQTAQDVLGYVGEKMQGVDLNAVPFAQGMTAAAMAPAAAAQAARGVKAAGAVAAEEARMASRALTGEGKRILQAAPTAVTPGAAIAAKSAEDMAGVARMNESYANAGRIDAVKMAQKHGLVVNPERSNPSTGATVRGAMLGEHDIDRQMAVQNENVWSTKSREAAGIAPNEALDDAAFKRAQAAPDVAVPYERVRGIPEMRVAGDTDTKLDALRLSSNIIGSADDVAKANAYLDKIKNQLRAPLSGADLLRSVAQLREDARALYRAGKTGVVEPVDRMLANARMGVADVLEGLIENNLSGTARNEFAAARRKRAQIFAVEDATNPITKKVDPTAYVKMVEDGRPLTGTLGEITQVAGAFPEVAQTGVKEGWTLPRITRTSIPGAIGGGVGLALGGPLGAGVGAALGIGAGALGRRVLAKNMLTEGYQAKHAVPPDFRQANTLASQGAAAAPRPTNALVPTYASEVVPPEYRPNFTVPQNPLPGAWGVRPEMPPPGPPRLQAPGTTDLQGIAAEQARRGRMAQMAEAEQAAAEAARPRQVAGTGMVFELDPISGKLTPVDRGIRGATPDTIQDYTATLRSAVDKLNSGQRFALSAAEKVAWDKTRVDLAEVMPGFNALEPKVIAERMMDRAWVADAVKKANEKAAAFDAIAKRSQDAQAVNAAKAARERMLDLAESLEEGLRSPRAGSGVPKEQGPRTKAAIRKNNLAPENKNNLTR